MGPDSRPRRRDEILAQTAGDTVILLVGRTGEYYTLNEVGGRIWELAGGERTVAEIARVLAAEYEAPEDVITGDALEILSELAREGLVDDAGAPA
jgi:hypothetical protein